MSYDEKHRLLHILWTKAVGTDRYDKTQWIELERALLYESTQPQVLLSDSRG